jgi:hypothetical protein
MRTMRWIITTFIAIAAMGFAARATADHTVVTTRTAATSVTAPATPVKLTALVTPARAAARAKPAKCAHGSQPFAIGTTSALNAVAVVKPCDVWAVGAIRNPFGKSANYGFAGASGGTCATSWFVERTFSSPAADQPMAVHC